MLKPFTLLAFATSITACSAILGLQEPTVDETVGDASKDSPTNPDSPIGDAQPADVQQGDGSCTKDCLGGACLNGVCQPVLVTTSTSLGPYAMVLDGTTLYFTNTRGSTLASVYKIDKTATNGTATLLADYNSGYTTPLVDALPLGIAVQGNFFYVSLYASGGSGAFWEAGIDRCPTTGCTTKTLAYYGDNSYAVAANSTNVFFSTDDINDVLDLQKAALDMTGRASFTTPASEINGLAVDGTDLFYASQDGVFHCAATCNATAITQGQTLDAELLALDANNVYFTSTPFNGVATVQSVARAGGPPKLISSKPALPFGVATDGTNVYFTDIGDTSNPATGAVYMCPVAGCANAEVPISTGAAAGDNPRPVVVDTNAIYWGTRGGSIWRLAK